VIIDLKTKIIIFYSCYEIYFPVLIETTSTTLVFISLLSEF